MKSKSLLVILFFILLTVIFFWKFFFRGLVPIPADIIVGVYYPWFDYKWAGFEAGVPVKNPLLSDVISFSYPLRIFVAELLKHQTFPLWNPLSFAGTPLFANFQSQVLYPTILFYFFMPTIFAWSLGVIIQPFLTLSFSYLFLRHLQLTKFASVVGAVVFTFSATSTIWLEYNTHNHVVYWLPLLLLAIDKFIFENKFRWFLLASVIFALQIFAGYPQFVIYSVLVVVSWSAFRIIFPSEKLNNFKTKVFLILSVLVNGIFIAAIQLLPSLELLQLSIRQISDISLVENNFGFFPFVHIITFLIPDFFGNPATYNYWGVGFYNNFAGYVGILTLILATLAIFFRKDRLSYFFLALVLFSFLLIFRTPLSYFLWSANILGFNSAVAARALMITSFAMGVLAALGMDFLEKKHPDSRKIFRSIAPFFIVTLGVLIGVFISYFILNQAKIASTGNSAYFALSKETAKFFTSLRNSIFSIFVLSISMLVIFATRVKILFLATDKKWFFVVKLMIVGVLFFDLFRFGMKYLSFSRPEFLFPTTPVIDFLKTQEQPFRIAGGDVLPANFWSAFKLSSASGYDAVYPITYSEFLSSIGRGINSTLPFGRVAYLDNFDSKLFDFLNVKYILALKYDENGRVSEEGKTISRFNLPKLKPIFEDRSVVIFENVSSLPRAFLVGDYIIEKDERKILKLLNSQTFNPQNQVILEEDPKLSFNSDLSSSSTTKFLNYEANQIKIQTTSLQNAILVISDVYYPGWKVYIDGREEKILRANYTFRAVVVPQGIHEVRFLYDPMSFKIGKLLSLATTIFY